MNENDKDVLSEDDLVLGSGSTTDTITISGTDYSYNYSNPYTIDMSSIGTITLNNTGTGYSTTSVTSAAGSYLSSNGSYNTWVTSPSTLITSNTSSATPGITVKGDAEFEGDIKIDGVSLRDTIKAITDRLAILVPDPKKLEKYEALQKAYKHYKLLESLCEDNDQDESK
jgi:hypothetical protein